MDKFVAITTAPRVVAQIGLHLWQQPQTQGYPARATRALLAVNVALGSIVSFSEGKFHLLSLIDRVDVL